MSNAEQEDQDRRKRVADMRLVSLGVGSALLVMIFALVAFSWLRRGAPSSEALRLRMVESGTMNLARSIADRSKSSQPVFLPGERDLLRKEGIHTIRPLRIGDKTYGMQFELGGADDHYGFVVTDQVEPPRMGKWPVEQWESGVWYYSER